MVFILLVGESGLEDDRLEGVGRSVGTSVGTTQHEQTSGPALTIRVLGPVAVTRRGIPVPLPRSRKVRALLAYLALSPGPVSRSRLCDLLWDVPNDPRGELRWCLSKLRGVLDDEGRRRVVAAGPDQIELDLSDCAVDAVELARAVEPGVG